jgi:hypothetical protein
MPRIGMSKRRKNKSNDENNMSLENAIAISQTLQISCTLDDLPDIIFENIKQLICSDSFLIIFVDTTESNRVSIINSLKFFFFMFILSVEDT